MYILLNLETMTVLHKHENVEVVCGLAVIECDTDYCVVGIDDGLCFKPFTDMELKALYLSITGAVAVMGRAQLIQVIYDLCHNLPVSDALEHEVNAQADYLIPVRQAEGSTGVWSYVKGARVPAKKAELFKHIGRKAKVNPKSEESAKNGVLPALKRSPASHSLKIRPVTAASTPTQTQTKTNAPKRGTAKALIWKIADQFWENAGKPTAVSEVLKLRKSIMDNLETEEGVKRTSASSELGNWQKCRIRN